MAFVDVHPKITTTLGKFPMPRFLESVLYLQSALVIATVFQKDLLELHLGALPPLKLPPSEITGFIGPY